MNALAAVSDDSPSGASRPAWNVLVVDDDQGVIDVTRLALSGLCFEGRPVVVHGALSARQARESLEQLPSVEVILLDVVMESDDAGLKFVQHVRNELGNSTTRIILRTGQPGLASPLELATLYEIDGYFAKTSLTALELKVAVVTALRAVRQVRGLSASRQGAANHG